MSNRDEAIRALKGYGEAENLLHHHEVQPLVLWVLGELSRVESDLAAMTAERDEARDKLRDKLDWLTEAYDRKMRVHYALNRDYIALRKRAEAAEKDIRDMLYESTLLIDDALCLWCEHYDEPHDLCWAQDCKAECKWRGPQEGKP